MNSFEQFKATIKEAKASIFGDIDNHISEMEASGDVEKFYDKGIKSAGGRLRKGLQEIRKTIHNPTNSKIMATIKDEAKNLRDKIIGK